MTKTDVIFTVPEYLKHTFLILADNPGKLKIVNNIRTLFEHLDPSKMNIQKDAAILIELIQRGIEAVDFGLKDKEAIFNFAIKEVDYPDIMDIQERLEEGVSIDIQNLMVKWIESLILKKPIYDKAETFAEMAINLKHRGLKQSLQAFEDFENMIEETYKSLKDIAASKVTDEILVDEKLDIGVEKVSKERDDENNVVIKLFGAMDAITGGGGRLRKTNLIIANTGCFKSGTLLNLSLYAQENAEIPSDFLNGMHPAILYITHENTLAQTTNRIMAWHGYSMEDIDKMSRYEYEKILRKCLMPKGNGVRIILKYIDPNTITIKDIDNMCEDLLSMNFKVVMCCEDYLKHVIPDMREDQLANNVQAGDVLAIQASALARKHFLSFWTASQFGREGQKIKEEQQEKGADFLKKMGMHSMAGAYNSTNSYDMILIQDKGICPGTKDHYVAMKVCKSREDRNRSGTDYFVVPFINEFKLHPTKFYSSVADMNPAIAAMSDIYNTALQDIQAKIERQEVLDSAKGLLKNAGYSEADLNDMMEIDILQRAKHLTEGGVLSVPKTEVEYDDYHIESYGAAA